MDFNKLFATDLISDAVNHVLCELSAEDELWKKLNFWKNSEQDQGGEESEYCYQKGSIPFDLLIEIHQQLQKTPMASGPVYLHELLEGSYLCLPELKPLPRNPELVARLEKIQAQADNKEYNKMVKNVDVSRHDPEFYRLGLEVQATSRQIWTVINFLFTVVGAFMFGYLAAYYAGFSIPACVCIGLIGGTAVFFADLYFLVRTDLVPPTYGQDKKTKKKKQITKKGEKDKRD